MEGIRERNILNLEREKEDITKAKEDFDLKEANAKEDAERELQKAKESLERGRKDFEFRIGNTESEKDRQIEDSKEDLENFKTTVTQRKETIGELISSVDKSLERMGTLQK